MKLAYIFIPMIERGVFCLPVCTYISKHTTYFLEITGSFLRCVSKNCFKPNIFISLLESSRRLCSQFHYAYFFFFYQIEHSFFYRN
jgi:hypothetical protein